MDCPRIAYKTPPFGYIVS